MLVFLFVSLLVNFKVKSFVLQGQHHVSIRDGEMQIYNLIEDIGQQNSWRHNPNLVVISLDGGSDSYGSEISVENHVGGIRITLKVGVIVITVKIVIIFNVVKVILKIRPGIVIVVRKILVLLSSFCGLIGAVRLSCSKIGISYLVWHRLTGLLGSVRVVVCFNSAITGVFSLVCSRNYRNFFVVGTDSDSETEVRWRGERMLRWI